MVWRSQHSISALLKLLIVCFLLVLGEAGELRECREQEYRDQFGNCIACKRCEAGQELSKECGFGYGADARCVPCRPGRFKEELGLHKCKPCLDCALVNRFQKANCSSTSNAACGDCMPGFYRRTKLSGFQDMECTPCGDPPPPYEPHCTSRVNLVPIPSTVTSPRDMALAAVICSALTTVLLALLMLCIIYCKRQLLEKKPSGSSVSQHSPFHDAELACFDRRWIHEIPARNYCQCQHGSAHICGPVHLIPSLCCDDGCTMDHSRNQSPFQSLGNLSEGQLTHMEATLWDAQESWPLMERAGSADLSQTDPETVHGDLSEEQVRMEESCRSQDVLHVTEEQHHADNDSINMERESYSETPAHTPSLHD